jgi:hypothetical protein
MDEAAKRKARSGNAATARCRWYRAVGRCRRSNSGHSDPCAAVRSTIGSSICSTIGAAVRATICSTIGAAVVLAGDAARPAVSWALRAAVRPAVRPAVVLAWHAACATVSGTFVHGAAHAASRR